MYALLKSNLFSLNEGMLIARQAAASTPQIIAQISMAITKHPNAFSFIS